MSLKILPILLLGSLIGVGAQDFYCPGQTVEFNCSDITLVKWEGSAFTGQCPSDGDTISFVGTQVSESDVGNVTTCGIFNATITSYTESPNLPGTFIVGVTLTFTAILSLNGTTVQCEDAQPLTPLLVDELIMVPETTTPTLSVDQVSQSSVNVNFVLDDNRCVSSYNVNVTEADDNTTTTSHSGTMSPVTVTGLDICQNNYNFVGYVTTENGEQSNVSMQVDFMIDFTVINPVTVTVNSPPQEPILSWMHDVNPQYLTCVIEFLVTSDVNNNTFNTTVGPNVRSLSTEQLNYAGFEYCVTLRPVVTPITGMGLLTLRSAMGGDTYLLDPAFPTPMLSCSFSLRPANETLNETEDTVTLRVTIQSVSNTTVPMRTFQYNIDTGSQTSETSFTGDYFEIDLGGAQGGEVVRVTVNFQDRECRTTASANDPVPSRETSTPALSESTVNSLTVAVTLPLTEYQPGELQIISSIEPADSGPITVDFTRSGSQYTVMFDGLDAGTSYTITIRIVLRADNTVDVVNARAASFITQVMTTQPPTTTPTTTQTDPTTTQAPALSGGCGGGCVGGIIAAVVAVFVVMIVVIVVVVIHKKKKCGSMKVTSQHEMEQQHKLTPTNGDEPGSPVKDEPATSDTFKTDGTSPGDQADSGNGATGGEGGDAATLIYADLDIAKKSKPKDPGTPTGAAATGGEEPVHYATIDYLKKEEGTEAEGTS